MPTAMVVTPIKAATHATGNKRVKVFDITLPDPYVDDGVTLTPATLGFKVVEYASIGLFVDAGRDNAVLVRYLISDQKLMVVWGNAGTAGILPEPGAVDLTAYSGRIEFRGY